MYTIIKNVIESGNFELKDMLGKIDKAWAQGGISDAEREELIHLARAMAHMDRGYADQEERFRRIEERLRALEEANKQDAEAPEQADEYPAFRQPTGAHDAFYAGAKMTFTDGKRYTCIAPEGYGVTYGPDILPGMWQIEK